MQHGACLSITLQYRPRIACRLGCISYSIYLVHPILMWFLYDLRQRQPAWLLLSGLIVATVLVAEVTFRFVEEPGIALGRKLDRRLFRAPRADEAAAPEVRRAA